MTGLSPAIVVAGSLGAAVWTVVLTGLERGYSSVVGVGRVLEHRLVLRACLIAGSVVFIVDVVAELDIGAAAVASGTLLAAAAVQVGRFFIDRREDRLRRAGILVERVLVVADRAGAAEVFDLVAEHSTCGWKVVACVGEWTVVAATNGVAYYGAGVDIRTGVERSDASVVVVTADALRDERTYAQLLGVRRDGIDVRVHAGLRGLDHRAVRVAPLGHDALLYLDHPRLLGFQRFAKRFLDITIASVVLVLTAPILAGAALAIKLDDRGPVVFRQWRVGRGGVPFHMPKLRSMQVDAERRASDLQHLNERDGGPLVQDRRRPAGDAGRQGDPGPQHR